MDVVVTCPRSKGWSTAAGISIRNKKHNSPRILEGLGSWFGSPGYYFFCFCGEIPVWVDFSTLA
jgi:hypothetical protein